MKTVEQSKSGPILTYLLTVAKQYGRPKPRTDSAEFGSAILFGYSK